MNAMMLSCVSATELMEVREFMPIGLLRVMQLNMHIAMCSGCRNYKKQTKLVNILLESGLKTSPQIEITQNLESKIIAELSKF